MNQSLALEAVMNLYLNLLRIQNCAYSRCCVSGFRSDCLVLEEDSYQQSIVVFGDQNLFFDIRIKLLVRSDELGKGVTCPSVTTTRMRRSDVSYAEHWYVESLQRL